VSHLELYLLGPPRVERDGVEVQIPRHKALALLAYLALTGQRQRRDALATLLWPENDQSTARAYLRRALTALRNALGEACLDADRETVGLAPDAGLWLDVQAFHRHLAAPRAHDHPSDETCPACLTALSQAATLYRDDFLAGFTLRDSYAFDDWQFFQAQGLRDELARALERLAQGYAAQGMFDQAIPHARRWMALDPLHEPAQRALMRLYAWAGQRAVALRQYGECERLLQEELGASPEKETVQLYQDIQAHRELPSPAAAQMPRPSPGTTTRQHNLPAQLTPFVGREALLAEIEARLADPGCRLLTLVGPGGSGKTRLALEAASRQLDAYAQGAWFVPLAAVPSVDGIVPAIAQAVGFSFHGEGTPQGQLIGYLRSKQVLLVLDNCEHLVEGAGLAVEILEAAPRVTICATSRVRLNVSGEQLHPIPGMDVPSLEEQGTLAPHNLARYSALKLFVAGARRVRPDFVLGEDNLADVVRICRTLEGMPLGILLAAAWVGTLSPADIADEVGRSLDFLETDWRDVPARQRSMRAVFDHSWALLGEGEREVLAGLCVLSGGFTREAAQRVVGASLRELMGLVNRSLVHRTAGARYQMHELLRQYAAGKLGAVPEVQLETRDRHCAYYAAALGRWDAELKGPRQLDALSEIEADLGNARAAWDWAVERVDVARLQQAMDGLCRFYEWRGRYQEGQAACRAAIEALDVPAEVANPPPLAADRLQLWTKAMAWRGVFYRDARRLEQARLLLEESLAHLEALASAGQDVRREKAFALWQLGYAVYELGEYEDARKHYQGSLSTYRDLGDRWGTAVALYHLGDLLQMIGLSEQAESLVRESLAIQQDLGDRREMAASLRVLGLITGEGERLARESVAAFLAVGDRAHAAEALINSGYALAFLGKLHEAHAQLEESVTIYRDLGFGGSSSGAALAVLGWVDVLLGRYGQARGRIHAALALAQEREYRFAVQISLYCAGLLAIAEGKYAQAQQLLQQSCSVLVGSRCYYWALVLLGYAVRGLGQPEQAWRYLQKVLSRADRDSRAAMEALPLIALLLVDRGEAERAVELYALASRHPYVANARPFEDIAGRDIAAAARTLPPEVVEAAQARGRARDLEATVRELLAELEQWTGDG
jgi:predicted ATPase/DNA-binding SARP family transcriptional activator